MNRLSNRVREARLKAKLTEKQLAKKCGLTASYIIQIESGKKIVKEQVADKILKALGEDLEFILPDKKEETPVKPVKKVQPATYNVQPNEQWSNALSGIIKKYSVMELDGKKPVGEKELITMGGKAHGHHPDKLMFVKVMNNEMKHYRIESGDVVMIHMVTDIQNNQLYLVESKGKSMIRMIRKEQNKMLKLYRSPNESIEAQQKDVKILGKCISVEFEI